MAQDHGPWLSTAMALLLVWSVLIFTVRIWAKLRTKNWGLDDLALSSALFLAVLQSALLWRALNTGYGHPRSDISTANATAVQKLIYASHIFYIIAMALCRVSAAFFVSHIAHSGPQSKPAHILAAISLAWGVASTFAITIRGDISEPWALMDGTPEVYRRWLGIESSGLSVDFTLWLLSIHLVWGLQMKLRKRLFVLTAFAVRLVLIPVVTFRLIYLRPSFNTDPYITTIIANIFTIGAIQFSIIACCVTSLKPFLHAFNQPSYSYNYKSGGTANSVRSATRDSYHRLETWRKIERTDGSANSNDPASWRPYQPTGEGHVTAYPKQTHSRSRDKMLPSAERKKSKRAARDDESTDTDSSHRMIIQRVTEVSVSYEDTSKSPLQ